MITKSSSQVPGPGLQRIYSRIEPYYAAAYLAEAVYTSGARQVSWVAGISATIEVLNQDVLAALSPGNQRQLINMRLDLIRRLDRNVSNYLGHVQLESPDVLDDVHYVLTRNARDGFDDLWRLQHILCLWLISWSLRSYPSVNSASISGDRRDHTLAATLEPLNWPPFNPHRFEPNKEAEE